MNREALLEYVLNTYGITPDFPWDGLPDACVLRHPVSRKWFALVMQVPRNRLETAGGDALVDVVNVKCDPLLLDTMRHAQGVYPAYHMNKNHWISVLLEDPANGGAADEMVQMLLDQSYDLTYTAPKAKTRKAKTASEEEL